MGVPATQCLGHMTGLMIDLFGEAWFNRGRMSNVKSVKPIADGNTLFPKAKVLGKEQEGSKVKYALEMYVENRDDENVL